MTGAMKMRRHVHSSHAGTVNKICPYEGDKVDPEDMSMRVE
jgi:biotin carboxyl carrier protein